MKLYFALILVIPALVFGQENFSFSHDGIIRQYIYYSPDKLEDNAPLVFVGHGYSGTAQGMMNSCTMNELADNYGFAVCYPEGTVDGSGNNFWNVGYDFHQNESVDDVGFILSLATYLQETYNLSVENTFATGMSNGGELCYLLACQSNGKIKAVAPVAGGIWYNFLNDNGCNPKVPMPLFIKHGTNDYVTLYEGDVTDDYWGAYLSVDSIVSIFLNQHNFTDLFIDTMPNLNNNQRITIRSKYSSPLNYKQLWLYKYENGGHNWGADDYSVEEEIWEFFSLMMSTPSTIHSYTKDRKPIRRFDFLGRDIQQKNNPLFIEFYDDGTVEKRLIID